jgi:two-component system, chemotaxis family, sensor histidine kinase and response regulator PixL
MNDSHIQAQAYSYFLAEAPELLQTIEQEILTLPNEHTTAKVHNLMRALHTLKGAAANVGLATIEQIAHDFEDLTRVFYNLEVRIDVSIQSLLLEGYSGLHECLTAQINNRPIDETIIIERVSGTIDRLKERLGDWTEVDIDLPTSTELGFDIVASIFETTVQEQIDAIVTAIATHDRRAIQECLEQVAETGIGLAESFELPGFLEIDRAILAAISHHPEQIEEIAILALTNIQQAQTEVLAGDRILGGTLLPELASLAKPGAIAPVTAPAPQLDAIEDVYPGEAELTAFKAFLIGDKFRKRYSLSSDTQHLFDRTIRLCWDWFRQEIQAAPSDLTLEILVATDGLADLDYIHHWIGLVLKGASAPNDRSSLQLYRQCCIYQVVFAVAKYLAGDEPHSQFTPEFLMSLRLHLQSIVDIYKQGAPITANERGWLDRIILPHHWKAAEAVNPGEDLLLSEIWGQLDLGGE